MDFERLFSQSNGPQDNEYHRYYLTLLKRSPFLWHFLNITNEPVDVWYMQLINHSFQLEDAIQEASGIPHWEERIAQPISKELIAQGRFFDNQITTHPEGLNVAKFVVASLIGIGFEMGGSPLPLTKSRRRPHPLADFVLPDITSTLYRAEVINPYKSAQPFVRRSITGLLNIGIEWSPQNKNTLAELEPYADTLPMFFADAASSETQQPPPPTTRRRKPIGMPPFMSRDFPNGIKGMDKL